MIANDAILGIGDALPGLVLPPLSRKTLALYAGGSGDHNPLHIDIDFARTVGGRSDVIGHGMLTVSYLCRLLTEWDRTKEIKAFNSRFIKPTCPLDVISCDGTIIGLFEAGGENQARIVLEATRNSGETLVTGDAIISLK